MLSPDIFDNGPSRRHPSSLSPLHMSSLLPRRDRSHELGTESPTRRHPDDRLRTAPITLVPHLCSSVHVLHLHRTHPDNRPIGAPTRRGPRPNRPRRISCTSADRISLQHPASYPTLRRLRPPTEQRTAITRNHTAAIQRPNEPRLDTQHGTTRTQLEVDEPHLESRVRMHSPKRVGLNPSIRDLAPSLPAPVTGSRRNRTRRFIRSRTRRSILPSHTVPRNPK